MLDTDPPAHTRLRALVNKGFTPRVVNTYEERIRGLARGILAQAFERDAFDWVEDVASEIPMWVFSEIMGLPVEDRRLLIELGDKLLGNTDPEVVGEENLRRADLERPVDRLLPFSSPFAPELIEYGCRLGEARRLDPRDDVTTRLVEAEIEGSRLSEHEFGLFFILLTTAGNETTRHTISLGLLDLLAHPGGDGPPDRRPVARRDRRRRDPAARASRAPLPADGDARRRRSTADGSRPAIR